MLFFQPIIIKYEYWSIWVEEIKKKTFFVDTSDETLH